MIHVICIGEAMVELRPAGPDLYARAIAGDAYNVAVYLSRSLGSRARVSFLTAIGDGVLGAEMTAHMQAQGLDMALAFPVRGALPGLYMIELDAHGDRSFHYWRSASAARRWYVELQAHGGIEALAGAELVYLSGISLAILTPQDRQGALDLLAQWKAAGGLIAFDPNLRPSLWPDLDEARAAVEAVCRLADIVLPSEMDGELIWSETDIERQLDRYARLGPAEIALTAGAKGAWLRTSGEAARFEAPPTTVVDTSGAGDSFNGGYIAARLQGRTPRIAAERGLALAARVVCAPGALIPAASSHPWRAEEP